MESTKDVAMRTERESVGPSLRTVAGKPPQGISYGDSFETELLRAETKAELTPQVVEDNSLKGLANEITQALSGFKSLRLSMDRELSQVVVRVMDARNDHVIRQIPSERMLDLVKQMRDLEGVLLKATA